MTAYFDLNISFITSLTQTPLKILISSPKILMTFLVIDHKSSYFPYFYPTFHDRTHYFSQTFSNSSLKNSDDLFLKFFPPLHPTSLYSSLQKHPFIIAHSHSSLHILCSPDKQ